MKKFQVLTDSTADVEKSYREEYDFDYLKNTFRFVGEEKEYDADLDWEELSAKEYYDKMRKGYLSKTSMVKTSEFEEKFNKYLSEGLDILYIACSSKLSGSYESGKMIAKELLQNYPDRKIICIDSLRSNYAEGLMSIDAAKMALDGMDIEEVAEYLENNKLNYHTYATVATLDYLKKAGRVKASKAFFGNLMGVKPIIIADAIGQNYSFKKVKGRKASLDEIVNQVKENIENASEATVFVEHADCLESAEYVADKIKELVNPKKINISTLGPIIGATTGPDTITVNFYGKKVTIVGED